MDLFSIICKKLLESRVSAGFRFIFSSGGKISYHAMPKYFPCHAPGGV
jgi:hypothetical protein